MSDFPALPGAYKALFLYIEPGIIYLYHIHFLQLTRLVAVSTALPAILIWLKPGAAWFHHELIPAPDESFTSIDARTRLAVWQLGNCALCSLSFFLSRLDFRAP